MRNYSAELDFALEVARSGSEIATSYYGGSVVSEKKPDDTWVTEADRAVEREIRRAIKERWPDHNVLGEEFGLHSAGGDDPLPGAPTWVVDPIDGTNNFMAGIPVWATLVALRENGESVVGVAHAPALGETYDAAVGAGARFNGAAIHVADVNELGEATAVFPGAESFAAVGLKGFFDALVERCLRTRGYGDFWGHVLVARGAAHVMVEPELSIWDVAALEPIVREAGGRITHLDGTPWTEGGSCLTTCGSLHAAVVALLEQSAPGWEESVRTLRSDDRPEP